MYLLKNTLMNKDRFLQLLESKLGNVKPLLNETYVNYAGQTQNVGTVDPYGGKATLNPTNQTLTLNQDTDCEQANAVATANELRILKGTTFKKVGNNLVSSNQMALFVDDYFGTSGTGDNRESVGNITISCTPTQGTYNVYVSKKPNKVWYGENWSTYIRNAVKTACSFTPPKPVVAQASKTQCDEYKSRQTTPVTANAGDIQTFLKNIGYKITIDYAFGDGTATALGTFMYGAKSGINSVATLWQKMKDSKLDVGTTPGFGLKMATAAAKWINGAIPNLVKTKCATVK
jgi:hypothetical protein